MPGRVLGAVTRRGRRRLGLLVLAALLAGVTALLAAGAASADAWPTGQPTGVPAANSS